MCNLYDLGTREEIERYFRADMSRVGRGEMLTNPVGPFGIGILLRPAADGLEAVPGQWGMIRPGAPARKERVPAPAGKLGKWRSTNNARSETMAKLPTFRSAWAAGQRCLIPAAWYQEPNWETGRNIWWQLRRADGQPWALAGLWSEWTDPDTGEIVPNYTAITINCDTHPLLNRLHKPDPKLPRDQQDKRSLVHLQPEDWDAWLHATQDQAADLLRAAPAEMFDLTDARRTDELLQATDRTADSGGETAPLF